MERLRELIIQLKEQLDRKAEPAQMLETTRLLEAELQHLASQPQPARVMPTKITVMMPSASKIYTGQANNQPVSESRGEPRKDLANQRNNNSNGSYSEPRKDPAPEPKKEPAPVPTSSATPAPDVRVPDVRTGTPAATADTNNPDSRYMPPVTQPAPVSTNSTSAPAASMNPTPVSSAPQEAPATSPVAATATATLEKPVDRGVWPFNPLADKPTDRFTLSQRAREVNDVIGLSGTSLNDKLKSDVSDLKSALNDTPVRDLKKAIGVNDRYVFINQLFRGDEVMYERSIKTINGFRILPEAEYWMERELKVKLGWDENRETTRHFYQLVKRRFS